MNSVGIGPCPIPSIGLLDFGPNGLSPLQFQFQMDYVHFNSNSHWILWFIFLSRFYNFGQMSLIRAEFIMLA